MRILICLLLLTATLVFRSKKVEGEYTSSDLNLRTLPNTSSTIMTVIPNGEKIMKLLKVGGWLLVSYNKHIGFVSADYVTAHKMTYLGNYFITAYEDSGCACANGNYPSVGYTVAHNTLPFGTRIYIEGVGERVVEDRGPGSLGSEWLDLYLGDPSECYVWGEQHRDVYLIEEE